MNLIFLCRFFSAVLQETVTSQTFTDMWFPESGETVSAREPNVSID